jgi:hypothetical protein
MQRGLAVATASARSITRRFWRLTALVHPDSVRFRPLQPLTLQNKVG